MYVDILEVLNEWLASNKRLLKLLLQNERLEARLDKLLHEYDEILYEEMLTSLKGTIPVDASPRV